MSSYTGFDDYTELEKEIAAANIQRGLSSLSSITNKQFHGMHNVDRLARDKLYTDLCETFVSRWKVRTILIEIYKGLFLFLLGYVCYLSGKELFQVVQQILGSNQSDVSHEALQLQADSIIAIVTAFVSFTSAIIALPTQIGKYLFNKDENKDAVDIIREMAKMDTREAPDPYEEENMNEESVE